MTAGKAIRIVAGGLAGAVILIVGSMLQHLVVGYNWLLVPGLFGGTIGLIVSCLLTKAQESNSDLEKHVDACNADLKKSMQECRLLAEKHERAKEAFIQKLELHEQVFNTMSNGVLVIGKDGEVRLVNGPALSLLHLENEFTTESLNDLLPHFDIQSCGPIQREQSVARITLLDGTTRLFGFSTSPLKNGGLVLVFQDVTAAVESQERKQRSEELALVGEMVSRLSHEIKNPLASILVGVQTLQRDTSQSSQQRHIVQLISEEVNSLVKIVNQLLESARPRTYSSSPVYVEPLLERCVDAHGFQADGRGVRLEIVRFPVSTFVLVDDRSMLRALDSLIQNALDACSRGDLIRIGWRELDQAGKDELVPGFSGKVVSLLVEDSGAGVPDELSSNESRIFKAFVSTKVSGSGLGLTVAQDIVEEHGGVLMVSSLCNRGTRVEILLPIPEGIPCWDWNSDKSVDCTSCHMRSTGTGYYCWKQKHGTDHADTGQWPERCMKCSFFRASSLTPFFRSRLVVSKVE
jgi:signal transduction histidine kinase